MVATTATLVIQGNPNLTPDQVKYRLKATARAFDTPARAGTGYLNLDATTTSATTRHMADQNVEVSRLLARTSQPLIWNTAIELSGGWQSAAIVSGASLVTIVIYKIRQHGVAIIGKVPDARPHWIRTQPRMSHPNPQQV